MELRFLDWVTGAQGSLCVSPLVVYFSINSENHTKELLVVLNPSRCQRPREATAGKHRTALWSQGQIVG